MIRRGGGGGGGSKGASKVHFILLTLAAFIFLIMCAYTQHHKRLVAVQEMLVTEETLRKTRDEVTRLQSELEKHHSIHLSERTSLVDSHERKDQEAQYYKTHNELLLEELKKIEEELLDMNRTEIAHIEEEKECLNDEIVIKNASEEDALKIKHAQDLMMKVLNGKAVKLHGHKPVFYNATKIQGEELVDENGIEDSPLEVAYRVDHNESSALPQYWVYQNEGRTHYSHMAMISALPKASLFNWIVCWQTAHKHEGEDNQHFRCSLSLDGKTWTGHLELPLKENGGCVWSPVLHLHHDVLFLFYAESESCMRPPREDSFGGVFPKRWSPGGTIKYVKSLDGIAWTKPTTILHQSEIDAGIPKVIANQPIVTSSGTWLLPWWQEVSGSAEPTDQCTTEGEGKAGVLISQDNGHTWRSSKTITDSSTWLIEGTLVELKDKSILQLFRTIQGSMFSSRSFDDGKTWSEAEQYVLPNPNSKFNIIKLESGNLLTAYNHNSIDRRRINLRVAISNDDGQSWYYVGSLQPDFIDQESNWQRWHYPTCIQDPEDPSQVYVVYSCDYKDPDDINKTMGGIRIADVQMDQIKFTADNKIESMEMLQQEF